MIYVSSLLGGFPTDILTLQTHTQLLDDFFHVVVLLSKGLTKRVIRSRKSKKNGRCNGQTKEDKKTTGPQNITQKTRNCAAQPPLKMEVNSCVLGEGE